MEQDWGPIFEAAFADALGGKPGAVPGAKFRQVMARTAGAQGVIFPPPNMGRFSEFLERFPEKVLIQRSPGRDILVVPAAEPERLSENRGVSSRLRHDLFAALTFFNDNAGLHYYLPETDEVIAVPQGSDAHPPVSAIPLPPASRDHEVELRKRFIGSEDVPSAAKETFEQALMGNRSLPAFSETVKRFGLSREWHRFRMADLISRMRDWAGKHSVDWNPAWLDEPRGKPETLIPSKKLQRDLGALIHALAGQITEADLSRISVPLDIVLKLLPSGSKG